MYPTTECNLHCSFLLFLQPICWNCGDGRGDVEVKFMRNTVAHHDVENAASICSFDYITLHVPLDRAAQAVLL